MGHRLSKICTRTGDQGSTGLGDGSRLGKDALRIEAIGDVDELNCSIGVVLAHELPAVARTVLEVVQHHLFDLGGELAVPGYVAMVDEQPAGLEQALEHFNAALAPLKEFVLPGGSPVVAAVHLARAVCRRAERHCVALHRVEPLNPLALVYLNRLSDVLFVLARWLTQQAGQREVLWRRAVRFDLPAAG